MRCEIDVYKRQAVDKAEDNQELAYKLNCEAPKQLASAAQANGAAMIQVSTDYVFDGTAHTPYTEDCNPCPDSVYGTTKLEGEKEVMNHIFIKKKLEEHDEKIEENSRTIKILSNKIEEMQQEINRSALNR